MALRGRLELKIDTSSPITFIPWQQQSQISSIRRKRLRRVLNFKIRQKALKVATRIVQYTGIARRYLRSLEPAYWLVSYHTSIEWLPCAGIPVRCGFFLVPARVHRRATRVV